MHSRIALGLALCLAGSLPSLASAQADVIVGDLSDTLSHGSVGSIAAFSVGTVSCNVGTANLLWIASTNQHPVIGLNMYKVANGRVEQIGMSWLKHGFTALTQSLCGSCNGVGGSALGVGCSDPYGAGLNGNQGSLGPRSEVNAATGFFLYPPQHMPSYPATIGKRIQVSHADLDPALNPGARYFVEGQYVTPDDAMAGNGWNNASYREVSVTPNGGSYTIALIGSTQRTKPAIQAWQDLDSRVVMQTINIPGDGRLHVGLRAIDLLNGRYRFEYAVHNLNSDRSVRRFTVPMAPGANISNLRFRDVNYHTSEVWNSSDWTGSTASGNASWETATFAQNSFANALRWGTTYSFSFEASAIPTTVELELFKPGANPVISVPLSAFPCPLGGGSNGGGNSGPYFQNLNAPYDFVDISATGNAGPTSDDGNVTANLGFNFNYYGTVINSITLNSNGHLYLNGQSGAHFDNSTVPGGGAPVGQICAYWDDLNPANGGTIRYQTIGSAPTRRFVAMWNDVAFYSGPSSDRETFCIILDETTNKITMSWRSTSRGGADASLGIEAPDGTTGFSAGFNTPGSVVAGRTHTYSTAFPETAQLAVTGNGSLGSTIGISLIGVENKPVWVMIDVLPGPTLVPNFGTVHLGLTPAFAVLIDGLLVPFFSTNGCGVFRFEFASPGLPPGLNIFMSGLIFDPAAPNQVAHLSNGAVLITP
ncbi:MAG: hypothetical protein JNM84_10250 [Planctomycetes bacterium]|nr:hypothetical protein [Planctomycetota bacterium]